MASQFDERYRIAPAYVENPGLRKRSDFIVAEQRQALARQRRRPENIAVFERWLESPPEDPARPLVGYFCNMIPTELIYAMGARPIRLGCGNPALVPAGEEVLAGDICPLARSSFGRFMDRESVANRCRLLILPASCDAKRKLGEVLNDFLPTFVLNLPPEQDAHRYSGLAARELERMADFLTEGLGNRLSRRALRRCIDRGQARSKLVRDLQSARARKPAALSARDLFIILQSASNGIELEPWLEEARKVLDEVRRFEPSRPRLRPRLVLTGAPMIWPNFKVLNLIEESGADVVADTLCSGAQGLFDPVVYDETSRKGLLRALAARYVFASPCPCFISQGTRLSRILDLVDEFKADGVVNYGLRLCPLFDMETYRLQSVLREKRIPFMNLRTDYSLEDIEQLRVRFEAYMETLGEVG